MDKISNIERGRFSPRPRNNPIYYNGDIPFVQTSDVVNSNGMIDNYSQTLNEKGLAVSKLFPKGTILITIAANIGYSGILQKDMACPDSLIGLKCKTNAYNEFLNYLLLKEQPRMDYHAVAAAQKNINIDFLKPYKFQLPETLNEQKYISNFLRKIDKRIATQSKIIKDYKLLKKGMLQQIFKQKLCFKDENGNAFPDWVERRLAQVATFFSGGTPRSSNSGFYSGNIPFIGSGDISKDKVENFITNEAYNSSSAKMVEVGDVLYALYGATSGEVSLSKIKGAINQAVLCIKTKQDKYFIAELLRFNKDNIVSKYLQGGQGNLSAKIVKDLKFHLPSLAEQQKIARTLSAIDEKIKLEIEILNKVTAQKQYLLQNLFV